MTNGSKPPRRRILQQEAEALQEPFRTVLAFLAVLYTPVTTSDLTTALTCWRKTYGDILHQTPLNSILDTLQQKGLITPKHQCHALLREPLTRALVGQPGFSEMVQAIQHTFPCLENPSQMVCLREMRFGLYLQNIEHFNTYFLKFYETGKKPSLSPLTRILNNPFSSKTLLTLPSHLLVHAMHHIVTDSLAKLLNINKTIAFLEAPQHWLELEDNGKTAISYLRGVCGLIQNKPDQVSKLTFPHDSTSMGIRGWLHFIQNNNDDACRIFETELKTLRLSQGATFYFPGPEGLFYLFALLKTGEFNHLRTIQTYIKTILTTQRDNPLYGCYEIMEQFVLFRRQSFGLYSKLPTFPQGTHPLETLISGLCTFWLNRSLSDEQVASLKTLGEKAEKNDLTWISHECQELIEYAQGKQDTSDPSLATLIPFEESWQQALNALTAVKDDELTEMLKPATRLIWLVKYTGETLAITPKMQKHSKGLTWSKGRSISFKRLFEQTDMDFLIEQDQKILSSLREKTYRGTTNYEFDIPKALPALIGHPHVFLHQQPDVAVEITEGFPQLIVQDQGDDIRLQLIPKLGNAKAVVIPEGPHLFKVIKVTQEHHRILEIIGHTGLVIPKTGQDKVMKTLGILSSSVTIHSEIGQPTTDIPEITPDTTPIMQLTPVGNGFRLAILSRPFGAHGPYVQPGHGAIRIIAEIAGKQLQTTRNFSEETRRSQRVIDHCLILSPLDCTDYQYYLNDTESCLSLMEELDIIKETIHIEWPEGQKLKLANSIDFRQFKIGIKNKGNWFGVTGTVKIDQDKVMDMRQLIQLVDKQQSRFIPLQNGQFVALSKSLKSRMDDLAAISTIKRQEINIHPLTSHILLDFAAEGAEVSGNDAWEKRLELIEEAQTLTPKLPSTLQAELRDYQEEGYLWLRRLAHWGGGACLADDMGLGKTVQALAVILARAADGPCLVVAPTSVCLNWLEEIQRFAPSLNPIVFGGNQREDMISELKPFDLLIASYGLLQQEETLLSSLTWNTIILDEAQAIKNIATKRSRAAMSLSGDFKVITTGTPIENHLGELWNLFHFINPGLLGNHNQFNRRFSIPIERHNDIKAKHTLKKIVQPFILRRLKAQVLEELPPRTEIVLKVEMSADERSFYEALRQEALANIQNETVAKSRPMRILAEITKLRQASCHPRLVTSTATIKSSKLALFARVTKDLLANRHKALVFSQFTTHLALIREYLDKEQISYQYLDGNTPAKERQRRVKAFQAGEGDLFLISLKAGGVGLNLTAADYVIHMDPWWNPAVEDQASDRAHRIGQVHPVTIYRLVTTNTIEEKIVALHHDKKELATTILDGTSSSSAINTEELVRLLQEQH
jgi:SNF2 family DNA or RNA helicase